jgi:hypothetical protein
MTDAENVNVIVQLNTAIGSLHRAYDVAVTLDAEKSLIDDLFEAERRVRRIRNSFPTHKTSEPPR